jgi:DNA-binding MarR family transcriptional regulator
MSSHPSIDAIRISNHHQKSCWFQVLLHSRIPICGLTAGPKPCNCFGDDYHFGNLELRVALSIPLKRSMATSFDINGSVVHLLHRADQCTGEIFASRLGHRDLTPRQFAVLVAVGARDGATQTTITDDTGIDRSTMVDVVRRLMKRGLLQRRRSRTDARSYVVRLTDDGRRIIEQALPEALDVDRAILTALAPSERDVFVAHLGKIIAALATAAAQATATAGPQARLSPDSPDAERIVSRPNDADRQFAKPRA